ncbi:EAL domain-containing protein [Motiliproteus sp. MSK22-1]|uniref:EAL domain-containing protein n=1 Tax=Motiliproteus sp. MSK22-1 TaxID=1897630 RepID=UPI000975F4D0|nr:EAL domain-containing protein [Motiliproteus sp. MSK22-1]OMH38040.1 hypothetical protein BGP75_07085 [Motiliproteus sp. MSK22-1]
MFGITARITLIFTLMAAVIIGLSAYGYYSNFQALVNQTLYSRAEQQLSLASQEIQSTFENAHRDTHLLTHTPEVIRYLNLVKHGPVNQNSTGNHERLASFLEAYLEERYQYFQIRLISPQGRELIKVESSPSPDTPRKIFTYPQSQLQDKSHRKYVLESLQLGEHQSYASVASLNREQQNISVPLRPTIRVAMPVYLKKQLLGLAVINLELNTLFSQLKKQQRTDDLFYLIDESGNFLMHPEPDKRFASELGHTHKLRSEFEHIDLSRISDDISTFTINGNYQYFQRDTAKASSYFPKLMLLLEINGTPIKAAFGQMQDMVMLITLLSVIACFLLVFVLSGRIVQPLTLLASAMAHLPGAPFKGDTLLPVNRKDELGILSRAFVEMKNEISKQHHMLSVRKQRFQAITENILDGIVIIDTQGLVQFCNPALESLFGYTKEELLGKNINKLMPEPYHHLHNSYLEQFLNDNTSRKVICNTREVEAQHCDGRLFPVELSVTQFNIDGEILFIGTLRDITQRKKTAQDLNEANQLLRSAQARLEEQVAIRTRELDQSNKALLQEIEEHKKAQEALKLNYQVIRSTSEAVVVTDANNVIVEVNDAYTKITGYSREEIIGATPSRLQSGRHNKEFYAQMWSQLLREGCWKGEIWDRRKGGEIFPKWLTINIVKNDVGEISHYVGVFSDISDLKQQEAELEKLAHFDPLTQLPNRLLFKERVEQKLLRAARNGDKVALMFLDLDHFKHINDSLGHEAGDLLLIEISKRLETQIRDIDTLSRQTTEQDISLSRTVARQGGDEFTIALGDLHSLSGLVDVIERMQALLQKPVHIKGHDISVNTSIGIAVYPQDGLSYEELTRHADAAMYRSKEAGRGNFLFFTEQMNVEAHKRLKLETEMRKSLSNNHFQLFYQPKLESGQQNVMGMEALVRWQHPEQGLIPPTDFIGIAEDTGLIIPLGEWILHTACLNCATWNQQQNTELQVAVNISAKQFNDPKFVSKVTAALQNANLPAHCLELEITERVFIRNINDSITIVNQLRDLGIKIAMDDFGTGYSSLSYLRQLPIDTLKIDRSFIVQLNRQDSAADRAIIKAIIQLGWNLKMKIVAEGIETSAHDELLKSLKCDMLQGYFYSKPLAGEHFTAYLNDVLSGENTDQPLLTN